MSPAEIAARLTPAQRRALLWLPGDGSARAWEKGSETPLFAMAEKIMGNPDREPAVYFRLCRRGKTEPSKEPGRIWARPTWIATPLGLAVRAVLEREQGNAR